MKKITTIVLALGFFLSGFAYVSASDIETDSKISEVTAYPDSALITRVATPKLNLGENKVIFSNIIPELDENSLKVSGAGSAEFKILGAKVKKEFLKEAPAEKVKQLQEEIQKLEDERKKQDNLKGILAEEKEFLNSIRLFSNGQIPKDLVTKMPAVKDLEDMLKLLDTKLKDNFTQLVDADLNIREVDKKTDVLRRELAEISSSTQKIKRSILVDLEVTKPGNLDLRISYLVRGASWNPKYDARANFEKSEVELISYGIITQTTGEDWLDIEMYLSTAKPSIGGRMPYIAPWFIKPYEQPRVKKSMAQYKSEMGMQFEAFDKVESKLASAEPQSPIYATPQEKGIAVVYQLPHRTSIKSDGSEHKLPISSQALKADFKYSAYPRVSTFAYLGSRVANAEDLQLLAGGVNIFLDGDYVGTSSIDNIGPGEEFDLYLGVDESVKIKREQIEKKVDETLIAGIPSPTKKIQFKYKLKAENYKSRKIKLKLFEALPVSENDRIKVKIEKASLEPKEKDWKDRKGVWLWELELEPKAKKEIFYTYIIEYPREMEVEGL